MSKDKENSPTTGPLNRDQIRAQIFGAKPQTEVVDFFGASVELRQPDLGVMLEARQHGIEEASIQMLINFCYVPDTQERVFDESDEESLRTLPMSPDIQRVFTACNKLLGIDMEGLKAQIENAVKSAEGGSPPNDDDVGSGGAGEK